eukprot:gene5607-5572_t
MSSVCNPGSGLCEESSLNVGSQCSDGTPMTKDDVCNSRGVCSGVPVCEGVECPFSGPCILSSQCVSRPNFALGVGECVPEFAPEGTRCNDGTSVQVCQSGLCVHLGDILTASASDGLFVNNPGTITILGNQMSSRDRAFIAGSADECVPILSDVKQVIATPDGTRASLQLDASDPFLQKTSSASGFLCYQFKDDT